MYVNLYSNLEREIFSKACSYLFCSPFLFIKLNLHTNKVFKKLILTHKKTLLSKQGF